MRSLTALLLVLAAPALAEGPTEEQKINALKRAYELNSNSMVGWGSIDMSQQLFNSNSIAGWGPLYLGNVFPNPHWVQTERIVPDPPIVAAEKIAAPVVARGIKPKPRDICQIHGLHKVVTHGSKSWRCK